MRKITLILTFLVVFSFGITCRAENSAPTISEFNINNGHKVIIKEVHSNPIVTIDTWVKTGSANETEKNNGISHFLEHLMFKGTHDKANGEFERILETRGARCNAATSKDFTHYYVTVASDYVDTAIKLHADMMQNPAIPSEEMEKERKVVLEEIRRAGDNPKRILIMDMFSLMFNEHPYRLDTLGPAKVVENLSRDEVLDYYNKNYVPTKMATVIVGDVNTQEVLSLMKDNFNKKHDETARNVKAAPVKRESMPVKKAEKVSKGQYKSGYALWGFRGVPIDEIKESYALDLASSILGEGRTSRLYQSLKEESNIVSSIDTSHYSLKDDSVFLVSADFSPEKFEQVKTAVIEEINRLKNEKITGEELQRAKTQAIRGFIYSNESVENIANTLGYTETLYGSIEPYSRHVENIEKITANDIKSAAKKYLNPDRLVLTALLPEETPVNVVSSVEKIIKNTIKSRLKNGTVLITNKNTSNDIISMSVFFKGGIYAEPVPGTADILAKTLLNGTKGRAYNTLISEIENSGITISPESNNDYFEIQLKSTKEEFNKAFDLLVDIIHNSVFEEQYIEKNKEDLLVEIRKSRDYPVNIASENFIHEIYKDHPYGHIGAVLEENVPLITRNTVVKYWKQVFIPENMIVAVSGDISHKDMTYRLLENFVASGKKPPEIQYNSEFLPLKENVNVFSNKKSEAAWIFLGWPVGNNADNKEFAAFKLLQEYLTNGLSSKLHILFREEKGLAYTVGCSYSPKLDCGHFAFYIGTSPDNIELVTARFLEEVERLKTTPLTEEEIESSKSKLIGNYALSQETNQNKAHLLGVFEVFDKDFGFIYDFPELVKQVTPEDIINVTNKYFNNPYVTSIAAPQDTKE